MQSILVCAVFQLFSLLAVSSGLNIHRNTQRIKYRAEGLFHKIIHKEVPCDFIHEDDLCLAFNDLNPQAPAHFIVLPKKKIISLAMASDSDAQIIGHMMIVAKKVAAQMMLKDYRVVVNSGREALQMTGHLHLHVLGGRVMHWPPG